jgi:uncharacterized protein YbaP (TraB family)
MAPAAKPCLTLATGAAALKKRTIHDRGANFMSYLRITALSALALALSALPAAAQTEPVAPPAPTPLICPTIHAARQTPWVVPALAQDYEPAPAMWKLADDDTTIYIFGTYHVLPQGFRWRTPLLDTVIAETDEVVFESRDDDEEDKAGVKNRKKSVSDEEMQFMTLMLQYRSDQPLSQRISERNRAKLVRLLDLTGIPLAQVEYAPPMMTMFAIAVASSEAEGSMRELGVETVIEAEFKKSRRPISAIEDPIAVMRNLFAIDEANMIAMIDEGLDEWDGCDFANPAEADWSSEHQWAQGKLDGAELAEMMEDPFYKAFYQVLLVDRNRAWTDWLSKRMEQPGNLLLAVGAGHMEGPDSVILMLEQRGFKIERIQ